jgi:hypothetical protein
MAGVEWAYEHLDKDVTEKDLHVHGTNLGPNGRLTFWLYQPRPDGVSVVEWDAVRQTQWDRIFPKRSRSEGNKLDQAQAELPRKY